MQAEKIYRHRSVRASSTENLKLQPGVFVTAARTATEFWSTRSRIKMLAAHTAKSGFFPGMFKKCVIAPVKVQPQTEKKPGNQ